MYNSTGCEQIVQNDKFISVILIYYFDFAIFKIYFHCFKIIPPPTNPHK